MFEVLPSIQDIYSFDDAARFAKVLTRVAKHLDGPPVVTGSFAVEWQILTRGGQAKNRRLNDIDLVALNGTASLLPGLGEAYLINHFHPTRESGNLLIQIVDKDLRTRVDIFSPRAESLAGRASRAIAGDLSFFVLSAEDLAARLLAIIAIVLDGRAVDPKYVDSFERTFKIADVAIASGLWAEYRGRDLTDDFVVVAAAVREALVRDPDLLKEIEYTQDTQANCPSCIESPKFSLADKNEVLAALGHV